MVATNVQEPELLRLGTVREVLRSPGPCITIVLPPYHPGEPAGTPAALLKANIQEASRRLPPWPLPKFPLANLLQPLERLAETKELAAGTHWGRAILRSPTACEQFHLTQPVEASLTIAGCFSIKKLAAELVRPRTFYILALAKTKVSLLRCAGVQAEVAKLPPGVPDTLAEALELERPDHDLENRSTAGSSVGSMRSVRFGTGSEPEKAHAHLSDFYKIVDRGIQELLREPETPLILAGVEEDTVLYRSVSGYGYLLEDGIPGSIDLSREHSALLRRAYAILRTDGLRLQRNALLEARERTAPSHFSTNPDILLHAAFEGRLDQLYVNAGVERMDVFERDGYRSWGSEDVLNLAMVQTIVHHGKAWTLPGDMMPDGLAAAGLLRF